MTRRPATALLIAALLLAFASAAAPAAAITADTFPGEPRQWEAVSVPATGNAVAVGSGNYYSLYFEPGETVNFSLTESSGNQYTLELWNPGAAKQSESANPGSSPTLAATIPTEGTWSVCVRTLTASNPAGTYSLTGTFSSPDDNIPGVPASSAPVTTHLDSFSDWDDVSRVWLNAGDTLSISASTSGGTLGFAPWLQLFGPSTISVKTGTALVKNATATFPKNITYTAAASGNYYIDLYEYANTHEYGAVTVSWKLMQPVYRFYNFTNNTHFLTPSPQERDAVMAKWSNVFRYEGVAYYTNPANNTQPLYRFYNRVSKSHFYTASAAERDMVMARWPNVFTYDGETYSVNTGPVAGSLPVYRFFNMRNGSHFYTASDTERDTVLANWPNVYRLEGPAFWIGQ